MNCTKTREQIVSDIEYKIKVIKEMKQDVLNSKRVEGALGLLAAYESLMYSLEEQKKVA